ncbi:MAG: hypothetical protein C3F06_10495 [Candidatus Methanoperedenaceae archaeon]|nr:MAG: hypothetical protein C3F06_10495 [Candidatus Methanoperedenaceae archaeon]
MKSKLLILILVSLILSGCIKEYGNVEITSIDVMSSAQDDGATLTITPNIQNDKNTDTALLSIKVKIREPASNLVVAEKDSDIGYIKSKSGTSSSIILAVSNPGEYSVEVSLLESGNILTQKSVPVVVKPEPGPGAAADIKLVDMNLLITNIYNNAQNILVDVSPGIYNQGGDSMPLVIEVTASVDSFTGYTMTDKVGIVKGESRIRGKVTLDIPRNKEYLFKVEVFENGNKIAGGTVPEKIKINEIKYNTPMTYSLVEEGKPRTTQTPGFAATAGIAGILLVWVYSRIRKKVR